MTEQSSSPEEIMARVQKRIAEEWEKRVAPISDKKPEVIIVDFPRPAEYPMHTLRRNELDLIVVNLKGNDFEPR